MKCPRDAVARTTSAELGSAVRKLHARRSMDPSEWQGREQDRRVSSSRGRTDSSSLTSSFVRRSITISSSLRDAARNVWSYTPRLRSNAARNGASVFSVKTCGLRKWRSAHTDLTNNNKLNVLAGSR